MNRAGLLFFHQTLLNILSASLAFFIDESSANFISLSLNYFYVLRSFAQVSKLYAKSALLNLNSDFSINLSIFSKHLFLSYELMGCSCFQPSLVPKYIRFLFTFL